MFDRFRDLFEEKRQNAVRVMSTIANLRRNPYVLASLGVLLGTLLIASFRVMRSVVKAPDTRTEVSHAQSLESIIEDHLDWAENEGRMGLEPSVSALREFFAQAHQGTRGFAEDILGWESKWKLAEGYLNGSNTHQEYITQRFAARIFETPQLEKVIEVTIAEYLRYLNEVDSMMLVRLEADLAELPGYILSANIDHDAIGQAISSAIHDAVLAVEAEVHGDVRGRIASCIAGEVLAVVGTRLATSAGILGVGAGSGTVTVGVGLAASIVADYCVSWAYDQYYDPVGEISRRMSATLYELENLIMNGDGIKPGLLSSLDGYAQRRGRARTVAVRTAILP